MTELDRDFDWTTDEDLEVDIRAAAQELGLIEPQPLGVDYAPINAMHSAHLAAAALSKRDGYADLGLGPERPSLEPLGEPAPTAATPEAKHSIDR